METYRGPYGIDDEAPTSLVILASVGNKNRHLGILIENLLNAAVICTLPGVLLAGGAVVGFFGITQIFRVGDEVWWVSIGVTTGRWSGIGFIGS